MKITGVTWGYDMKPHLCFDNKYILFGNADRVLYKEYFAEGDWPIDPITKEKLPISGIGGKNKCLHGLMGLWYKVARKK